MRLLPENKVVLFEPKPGAVFRRNTRDPLPVASHAAGRGHPDDGRPFFLPRSGNHTPSGTGNANLFYFLPGEPRVILVQERVKTARSGSEPGIDAFLEAFAV